MPIEDLKNKNNEGTNNNPQTTSPDNNQELESAKAAQKAAEERAAEAEFNSGFLQISQTYPLAGEHRDAIREKVKSGYSLDDATVAILNKEGKLKTKADIDRESNRGTGFGGSSSIDVSPRQPSSEPTVEDAAKAFQEAEARGEIKLS